MSAYQKLLNRGAVTVFRKTTCTDSIKAITLLNDIGVESQKIFNIDKGDVNQEALSGLEQLNDKGCLNIFVGKHPIAGLADLQKMRANAHLSELLNENKIDNSSNYYYSFM